MISLSSADNLCRQFGLKTGPIEGQSWSGSKPSVPERFFENDNFEKKSADDLSMKIYPACKEIKSKQSISTGSYLQFDCIIFDTFQATHRWRKRLTHTCYVENRHNT